jgi:hypothetical protein
MFMGIHAGRILAGKTEWLAKGCQGFTILLLVVLGLLYSGWLTYVIAADRPLDFYVYYMAAELVAREQNPYTISDPDWDTLAADLGITNYTRPYRYPPYTALSLLLIRPLGPQRAMVVWVTANALAMVVGAWLIGKALGGGWWIPISLTTLLFFVPPLATLLAGQINGLLFLCLALALWAISRGRAGWLGISLAAGTVLKVIPLALILYLFWRRQWQAALIAVVVLLGLTLLVFLIVGGEVLLDYAQKAIFLGRPDRVYSTPTNQTITAVLGRAFPATTSLALLGGRWLGLLLIIVTAILCWPVGDSAKLMLLEFALIVAALQLIPPFTWYHQLVLLHLCLLVAMRFLWTARRWWWLAILIVLYSLANLHGLIWQYIEDWTLLTSFPFLFGLTLWVTLAYLIIEKKRQSKASD